MDAADATAADYFVCGGFGGICSTIAGHPLDTVKVRMQSLPQFGHTPFTGMLDTFAQTIRKEGVSGLYKGMLVPLCTVTPIFAVSFCSYRVGKELVAHNDPQMSYRQKFFAGAFSGFVTSFLMAPAERIKSVKQVRRDKSFTQPWHFMRGEYAFGGIRAVFRGFTATAMREVPFSGIYFISFEMITKCTQLERRDAAVQLTCGLLLPAMVLFFFALPFDVLKSRYQTAPRGRFPMGMRQVYRELVAHEGYRALYRGATPMFVRLLPAYTACFYGFAFCHRYIVIPVKDALKPLQYVFHFEFVS